MSSKPGKWLYVVAGAIALLGSSASIWRGCSSSMDSIRAMDRRVMPGTGEFDLPHGRHQVFLEITSIVDGERVGDGGSRHITCNFATADGSELALHDANHTETYNLGGYNGQLQWELEVERPGKVIAICESDRPGQFVLAFGEGFTVSDLLWAILGFAASIMIGLAVFFFTFIRRRSAKEPAEGRTGPPAPGPGTPPT